MAEAALPAVPVAPPARDARTVLRRALLARCLGLAALVWVGVCAVVGGSALRGEVGSFDLRQQAFATLLADSAAAVAAAGGPAEGDDDGAADTAEASRPGGSSAGLSPSLLRALDAAEQLMAGATPGQAVPLAGPRYAWQLLDARGRLIARSTDAPPVALASRNGTTDFADPDGRPWRVVRRASGDGRRIAIVAEPLGERVAALVPRLLAIGGGLLVLALLAARLGADRSARGIATLHARLHPLLRQPDVGGMRLDPRGLPAEVAPVAGAINAMLERCSRRIELEREFVADAVHELRTPLAAVLAQSRLVADARDDVERRGAESSLRAGIARVSHLLQQVQTMSWLSAPQGAPTLGMIDAAELTRLRVASLSALARERFVRIALEADERVDFDIDPTGLASIVDNLVDNAIRHAEFCGTVEVRLQLRGETLHLEVLDDGPGIPVEHRQRVFERFHRVPGNAGAGTGLGLSIVKRVADLHGARVTVGDGLRGRGAGIAIEIPPPGERPGALPGHRRIAPRG